MPSSGPPRAALTCPPAHPRLPAPLPQLRTRVWPLLLGVEPQPHDQQSYEARHSRAHADSHVVQCDMERSLWSFTEGWGEAERAERRGALRRVLDATIASNARGVHYYQGLHDIAAVLLFVCGERLAYRMLAHLTTCHLRDCTRHDLGAATEVLRLLYPILEQCDPGLHAYIQSLQEPALEVPYFALSWYMTWFAHDVPERQQAARLFDLFLASHPLMPLYLAAVAIKVGGLGGVHTGWRRPAAGRYRGGWQAG